MAAPNKATSNGESTSAQRVGRVGAYPEAATKKISVSIDLQALEWAQKAAKAQGRSLSSLVSDAVAKEMRLAYLGEWLAEAERTNGPVPQAEIDRVEAEWREHEQRLREHGRSSK